MKTSIKTLIATGLFALAISTSAVYANDGVSQNSVSASAVSISSVQKIIVSGNVYVTIVQASKSKVLFENENNETVVVKKVNDMLIISADNANKVAEITVYVDNIYRIDASGSAIVKTKGTLALKNLQIFVKDNAVVEVNSNTESLYTVIKDRAELKLEGHSDAHILTMDKLSKVTLANFSANKTEKTNTNALAYAAIKK